MGDCKDKKCGKEEKKQTYSTKWWVYEGPKDKGVEPETLIAHIIGDKDGEIATEVIFSKLDEPTLNSEPKSPMTKLTSIEDYVHNHEEEELTNWDFKVMFKLKAGQGPILFNGKASYVRNFNVPACLYPHLKIFFNSLDPDLERTGDPLGEKPITIRMMSTKHGELYIKRKIMGATQQSIDKALNKYQNMKRKLDRLILESLPLGDVFKIKEQR